MEEKLYDFSEALKFLKQGHCVARNGWNGKNMFIYYVSEGKYPVKMEAAKPLADENGLVSYGAYIAMKTAQGNVVPWLASQTDMLSEDWVLLGSEPVREEAIFVQGDRALSAED